PDLSKEIILLAKSSRPDSDSKDKILLLSTRGSTEPLKISSGQQVFLECQTTSAGEPKYNFTNIRTPLWIRPVENTIGDLQLEVGYFAASVKNEGFHQEVDTLNLASIIENKSKHSTLQDYLLSLRQLKWWGNDCLIRQYGGNDYQDMERKQKLEIFTEGSPEVYYVEQGDFLQWQNGQWHKVVLEESHPELPLAKIKDLSSKNLEIEAWDPTGFYSEILKFTLQSPIKPSQKNDLASSSARLRSSTQVSLTLGKRRLILKEGDWLLKMGKTWRNLRRSKDIDDCIFHKIRGELFIFDNIEKQQGKLFMKGHLFDEMRTGSIPVSIPISTESTTSTKSKRSSKTIVRKVTAKGISNEK
ncbi:MAG: hypothetical protein EBZ47_06380, partial [Chlamydiae bacterium]|nr:hypothetical protein [Chlamydiota bacterium]